MVRNTILTISLVLSSVLALSVLAKADLYTTVFAQTITPKMHLEEGIKVLKTGDTEGALMHLNEADKGISDQTAKMHLDAGIKAVKDGDTEGALMHLNEADKALGG